MRKKKKGEIGKAKRKKRGRERSGRKERERERGEDKNNKKDVWVGNPQMLLVIIFVPGGV